MVLSVCRYIKDAIDAKTGPIILETVRPHNDSDWLKETDVLIPALCEATKCCFSPLVSGVCCEAQLVSVQLATHFDELSEVKLCAGHS